MKHQILLTRKEGLNRISQAVFVQFVTVLDDGRSSFDVLKAAVTEWVRQTGAGRECWDQSGGDLNIGDLASYYSGESMLVDYGIRELVIESPDFKSHCDYDRLLADWDAVHDDESE